MSDAKTYGPKMLCAVDESDLNIQGVFDSSKAQNLMLVFERCDATWSPVECQSEAAIEEWMVYKYIVVLANRKTFQ